MTALTLKAQKRETSTKSALNQLRKSGGVPATVYGLTKEPASVSVVAADLRPLMQQGNRNAPITLEIDGQSEQVIIRSLERDAIRRDVIHIDFLRVDQEHRVTVSVKVNTHGVPYGVKTEGGVFSTMKKDVKLRARIQDVPEFFNFDVSELRAGTTFYVKDLVFEKGTFVTPPKTALYGVSSVRKKEE